MVDSAGGREPGRPADGRRDRRRRPAVPDRAARPTCRTPSSRRSCSSSASGSSTIKGMADICRRPPGRVRGRRVTAAVVVVVGVEQGIILAMVLSIVEHIYHSYRPYDTLLGADAATGTPCRPPLDGRATQAAARAWWSTASGPASTTRTRPASPRRSWSSSRTPIRRCAGSPSSASAMGDIDYSGADAIRQVDEELGRKGVTFACRDVDPKVRGAARRVRADRARSVPSGSSTTSRTCSTRTGPYRRDDRRRRGRRRTAAPRTGRRTEPDTCRRCRRATSAGPAGEAPRTGPAGGARGLAAGARIGRTRSRCSRSRRPTRIPELVPVRYGRMAVSPFTFYRGAALPMAADLAATPDAAGSWSSSCGDAHLSNFGLFASPERDLRLRHQRLRRDAARALGVGRQAPRRQPRGRRPRRGASTAHDGRHAVHARRPRVPRRGWPSTPRCARSTSTTPGSTPPRSSAYVDKRARPFLQATVKAGRTTTTPSTSCRS